MLPQSLPLKAKNEGLLSFQSPMTFAAPPSTGLQPRCRLLPLPPILLVSSNSFLTPLRPMRVSTGSPLWHSSTNASKAFPNLPAVAKPCFDTAVTRLATSSVTSMMGSAPLPDALVLTHICMLSPPAKIQFVLLRSSFFVLRFQRQRLW